MKRSSIGGLFLAATVGASLGAAGGACREDRYDEAKLPAQRLTGRH